MNHGQRSLRITLCGSTKFMEKFHEMNRRLSLAGHLVFMVATSVHADWTPTVEEKETFDLVYFKKILESDAVLVLNVGGYVGESTRREIKWARLNDVPVYYLEVLTGEKHLVHLETGPL